MSSDLPVTVGVARDETGALYVPAQQVTDLLRQLARQWTGWAADGDGHLDLKTVDVLAERLRDLADQVDVECIARANASHPDQEEGEP